MAAATYLVHKGVPFRTAHEKIGNAVRFALEKGVELGDLDARRTARSSAPNSARTSIAAITLQATLDCHDVIGGTARERVQQAFDEAAERDRGAENGQAHRRPFMLVRKALLQDASNIYDLVNSLSGDGTLLKRAFAEICENIRDFTVAESDGGVFLGCGALHLYGPHLCEVRSIVVKPEAKGQGAGGRILGALIEEAEEHGIQSVCLFTRIPDFFFKYGFRTVEDKSELPDKIFKDCQNCPRLHRCDEVAMVRGRIPRMSILGPKRGAAAGTDFGMTTGLPPER